MVQDFCIVLFFIVQSLQQKFRINQFQKFGAGQLTFQFVSSDEIFLFFVNLLQINFNLNICCKTCYLYFFNLKFFKQVSQIKDCLQILKYLFMFLLLFFQFMIVVYCLQILKYLFMFLLLFFQFMIVVFCYLQKNGQKKIYEVTGQKYQNFILKQIFKFICIFFKSIIAFVSSEKEQLYIQETKYKRKINITICLITTSYNYNNNIGRGVDKMVKQQLLLLL
eukprot:TRINITY_DN2396_c0_g1_i11.p3 TRINITY_DN2396_c0_g1~~TRINITY_DN2396_c0_g1_i11.p3  ORF type:complete len:222 (-),score=-13.86 TRINITY_DN2396_c0_g1_i11:1278-1943(-)